MVAGQQSVILKYNSRRKMNHFNGDSPVFAAGCILTITDSSVNRQKAANDFCFLVNSCLKYSALPA